VFAYILVDVPAGVPRDLENKIRGFAGVVEARTVYGSRYDIIVRVEAEKASDIYSIADRIQNLKPGTLTSTFEAKEE